MKEIQPLREIIGGIDTQSKKYHQEEKRRRYNKTEEKLNTYK